MPHIGKERSWAQPKQLPAGPRKKRPLGRLFSSEIYIWDEKMHFTSFTSPDMIPTIRLTRKMEMESPDSVIVYMKVDKV